jgi:L-asparaginase II
VDGCSAPTFELPLDGMARGFRNLTNHDRLGAPYLEASRVLVEAVAAHPLMIAGHDRFDSDLIATTKGRVFCKIGAEGFIALGIVGKDVGVAIKIDDGATRGYIAVTMKLLEDLDLLTQGELEQLARYRDPRLRNHAGLVVGTREVVV